MVLEDFSVGGAQIFAVRLANSLSISDNVFIYNCHPTIFDGKLIKLISHRVKIVHYNSKSLLLAFWLLEKLFRPFKGVRSMFARSFETHNLKRLKNLALKNNLEIINSHMFYADLFAGRLKVDLPQLKHFISMHGCYENKFSNSHHPIKSRGYSTLSNCDGVIIAADKNKFILNELKLSGRVRVEKIYYGLPEGDKVLTLKKTKASFTFGIVSRAIKEKGWEELILAFLSLKMTYPDIQLILVGAGPFQRKLQYHYKNDAAIKFMGHTSSPMDYIREMDVCVLPTYFKGESLPNSIIEYLSEGKPIIATEIGEIRQMLEADGDLAGQLLQLTEKGLVINDLKDAMEKYIVDFNLVKIHAELARIAFRKFSMEECLRKYGNYFKL
ncbi:MAG: glycosyltransferase family 4 protein [Saprospiraceae bacterium]